MKLLQEIFLLLVTNIWICTSFSLQDCNDSPIIDHNCGTSQMTLVYTYKSPHGCVEEVVPQCNQSRNNFPDLNSCQAIALPICSPPEAPTDYPVLNPHQNINQSIVPAFLPFPIPPFPHFPPFPPFRPKPTPSDPTVTPSTSTARPSPETTVSTTSPTTRVSTTSPTTTISTTSKAPSTPPPVQCPFGCIPCFPSPCPICPSPTCSNCPKCNFG